MNLVIFYFLFLTILTLIYPSVPSQPDFNLITSCLVMVLIFTFMFFKRDDKLFRGQFFRHSYFIVFGYLVVHFQYYIDLILGNSVISNKFIWVNAKVINKAIILSTIGIISFFIGYLSFRGTQKENKQLTEKVNHTIYLQGLSFVFLILYFSYANPLYFFGNYGILELGSVASYVIVLFEVCILATLIQHSRNLKINGEINITFFRYIASLGFFFNFQVVIYLISVIVSGDRGPIFILILAYSANYLLLTRGKINFFKVSLFIFAGSMALTVLGNIRAIRDNKSFSDKAIEVFQSNTENRYGEDSFLSSTQNLATSVRCLHHAVDYVPDQHANLYGRFQFQQITSTVPFFSNLNVLFFQDNHWKYNNSANFITWKNQGEFPYSSDGTTVVSDFYLDFGLVGVIIGLFTVGFFTRYSELIMYHYSSVTFFQHTFFSILLCFSFYLSRSSFVVLFKIILWTYFFLILNKHILNKSR